MFLTLMSLLIVKKMSFFYLLLFYIIIRQLKYRKNPLSRQAFYDIPEYVRHVKINKKIFFLRVQVCLHCF